MPSPVGELLLTASPAGVTGVYLPGEQRQPEPDWELDGAPFATCRRQLDEYFAGDRVEFSVPLAPPGTPFQQQVWNELVDIEYGTTISYTRAGPTGRPTELTARRRRGQRPQPGLHHRSLPPRRRRKRRTHRLQRRRRRQTMAARFRARRGPQAKPMNAPASASTSRSSRAISSSCSALLISGGAICRTASPRSSGRAISPASLSRAGRKPRSSRSR